MNTEIAKKLLEKTKKDYEKIVVGFDETRLHCPHFKADLEQLVSYAALGSKVLDVGCGNGRLFELLQDKKVDYCGFDNCAPLIERAKTHFPAAKFLIGDALDLTFLGEERFDIVFSVAVLHHIPSRELRLQALKNINKVLNPKSLLVMTNWNLYQPKYLPLMIKYASLRAARKIILDNGDLLLPWQTKEKIIYRYYHAFTKRELEDLLAETGFELLDFYYVKNGKRTNWIGGANLVTIARRI
jgi:SAM-dependent methyltransferase